MAVQFNPFEPVQGTVVKSKLATSPFIQPEVCASGRKEEEWAVKVNGKLLRFTARDKIVPEDVLLNAVKAAAFSLARAEQYRGLPPSRAVRDFFIKGNVSI